MWSTACLDYPRWQKIVFVVCSFHMELDGMADIAMLN